MSSIKNQKIVDNIVKEVLLSLKEKYIKEQEDTSQDVKDIKSVAPDAGNLVDTETTSDGNQLMIFYNPNTKG
jgi:hypothetical protein